MLGKWTVEKTSLLFKYIKNTCPEDHDPTVEDLYSTEIQTSTGEKRRFKILDKERENDYQKMKKKWIKKNDSIFILFDVNNKQNC